jgi:hypothetical protein
VQKSIRTVVGGNRRGPRPRSRRGRLRFTNLAAPSVAPAPSEHLKVQPEDGVDEDGDAADKDVRAVRRRDSPVRPGLARSVASIAVRAASTALVHDLTVAREHVLGALY